MAMAFSHTSPQRLAYISREWAGELPSNFGKLILVRIDIKEVWTVINPTHLLANS